MNPLAISWLFMNSIVLCKLNKFKYLFLTSFLLTITTVLHHSDYETENKRISQADKLMCFVYLFHTGLVCFKSLYFWIFLFIIGFIYLNYIDVLPIYQNGWEHMNEKVPHFIMHFMVCMGVLLSLPNK